MQFNKKESSIINNKLLMEEWNYEKNTSIKPESISLGSGKYLWWKCKMGHEWKATVASRNQGAGCPFCSGRYAVEGLNDFGTLYPEILVDWDYSKNDGINPYKIKPHSHKKVWWKCIDCGYEWQSYLSNRIHNPKCPNCNKS